MGNSSPKVPCPECEHKKNEEYKKVEKEWCEKFLPSPKKEFIIDFSRENERNRLISAMQALIAKTTEGIPYLGKVICFLLEQDRASEREMMRKYTDNAIQHAIYQETKRNLSELLEGILRNFNEFELLRRNNNTEKSQQFTCILNYLKTKENVFKREDNMTFYQLEAYLQFVTLHMVAHSVQIYAYNDIYGTNDRSAREHKELFLQKAKEFSEFFQKHCDLFLYKKISTLIATTVYGRYGDDLHVSYKGQCCGGGINFTYSDLPNGKKCPETFLNIAERILKYYYPKVEYLVDQFNILIAGVLLNKEEDMPAKVKLKKKLEDYYINNVCEREAGFSFAQFFAGIIAVKSQGPIYLIDGIPNVQYGEKYDFD